MIKNIKYEYKERVNTLNGKEVIIHDLIAVDGLKITTSFDYNNEKIFVELKRFNDDIAIYVQELFYGKITGTKTYFIFDRKTNLVVDNFISNPKKDDLKRFTTTKLNQVNDKPKEKK